MPLKLTVYILDRFGRAGAERDTRDDPGDYAIVITTLILRNFLKDLKGLEVRAQSKTYSTTGMLPDDMPMPGINVFLELQYAF